MVLGIGVRIPTPQQKFMRYLYRVGADIIFLLHFFWIMLGMFGWLLPALWYPYLIVLILTLLSYFSFRRCIFTVWEFNLRKKADPTFSIKSDWMPYYTYQLTHKRISDRFLLRAGIVFLTGSLVLNLYFHYFFV